MIDLPKKLSSNTPPQKSILLNRKILSYLLFLLFIAVTSISLFICSSCAIPKTNYQDNQNNTIINYEIKSKETNIPTATETYTTNTVNWCIYNDGALVINGNNANTYNGHSGIKYSSNTTGKLLNLNMHTGTMPWSSNAWGSSAMIKTVEFAQTTKPTSMWFWFAGCSNLTTIDSTNLDTSALTDMGYTFSSCSSLSDLSVLSGWDVSAVTKMNNMFYGCSNLSDLSALSHWDVSAVTNMSAMFQNCSGLTDLSALSHWDVSAVTNMKYVFYGCSGLTDLSGLSDWDVSAVKYMSSMFYGCQGLVEAHLDNWNVSYNKPDLPVFDSMFEDCSSLRIIHLDNWKILGGPKSGSNRQTYGTTNNMFKNCSSLEIIYCKNSWSCADYDYTTKDYKTYSYKYHNMFYGCPLLHNNTTGKINTISSSDSSFGSDLANPQTGLFTMPESIAIYTPTIQKTVLNENNQSITDWDFESGQFTFIITSDDPNAPLPEEREVLTDDNGQSIWSEIDYYDPGEYIYKIVEKQGNIPGMTYDTLPHELKITIKEE